MNILIQIVDHSQQRYNTVGDWYEELVIINGEYKNVLKIVVSETGSEEYNNLIALHELVEALLCKNRNITESVVDQWDKSHPESLEPAEVKGSPYFMEHFIATTIEHMISLELGVGWNKYEDTLEKLMLGKMKNDNNRRN